MIETLRQELLRLKAEDGALRRELVEAGQLYGPHLPKDWYNPRMAALHRRNTARLRAIVAEHGWPGAALAGADGAEAAWFIAQHALLDLDFQRQALAALTAAVERGDAPAWQMAMLTDRVRMGSGLPQVYGSIHVGDDHGNLVPYVTEEPEAVEARRAAVGLPPLSVKTAELKARVEIEQSFNPQTHPREDREVSLRDAPEEKDANAPGVRKAATMDANDDLKQAAQDFVSQLVQADYAGAGRRFDSVMAQAMPEAKLKETWLQLLSQVGPFQKILACQAADGPENRLVTVSCQFEKAHIDFRLAINHTGQISGLHFQLAPATTPYHPPAYVHPELFHDVEVTVGSGEWALPATLSVPEGAGPFPALVLVHGSGPQDRDEGIGPNKPFRDLAWGLASQGIAVLRYEKRTKAHGGQLTPILVATLTVQEEVIDDALYAVQLLRHTPGIDLGAIYVLGHSLGATLAPRIGQQDPSIAGLIIMAGMARPLEDTILDQYTYLYGLTGSLSEAHKAELDELKAKVARAKDPNLSDQVPAKDLPLGVHPAYWLALRGYQPAEVAKSLAMRMLVLQGGRDYQVSPAGDFPVWQRALADKGQVTFKLYPLLSHLFIAGEGPSTPQEYFEEGHISEEVIQDIARWIRP